MLNNQLRSVRNKEFEIQKKLRTIEESEFKESNPENYD